ncbi:MAG: hypothetical protein IJ876_00505 [Elusimicrobiaceae bacterium]|nr:hypothetical protein [Elusimicrobiaceae bacterium]
MKKVLVGSLLIVLVLSAMPAFAQFKTPVKAAKNLANLDRVVTRATRPSVLGRPVVTNLPQGVVRGNSIGLLRVKMPTAVTPATQSYVQALNSIYANTSKTVTYPTPASWAPWMAHEWLDKYPALYEDQSQLARDLDAFYKKFETDEYKVARYIGPDGREVNLYTLPADGILYKPAEYADPVVLNSKEYFVIYDIESKTGKIAENVPEVYGMFKPVKSSAVESKNLPAVVVEVKNVPAVYGMYRPYKFSAAEEKAESGMSEAPVSHEKDYGEWEEVEVEPGLSTFIPESPRKFYEFERDEATNHWRVEAWEYHNPDVFNSQDEFINALEQFHGNVVPKAKNLATGNVFRVYEMPKPLSYYMAGDKNIRLEFNPKTHVIVLEEQGSSGGIMQRTELENPQLFEFVK